MTRLDSAVNWCRKNSMWPMPYGIGLCAIELMAAGCQPVQIFAFGAEVYALLPRQSDVMIVAGRLLIRWRWRSGAFYQQMAEPKWVIAPMGACASTGGMYRR